MTGLRSYEELIFWRLSDELRGRVFAFCAKPSVAQHRRFCEDLYESARSAPANIAEGFGRFRPHDNAKFVLYALGSLAETKNHLKVARDEGYISEEEFRKCWRLAIRAVGAGNGYHQYLKSCSPDGPHNIYPPAASKRGQNQAAADNSNAPPAPAAEPNANAEPEPEP